MVGIKNMQMPKNCLGCSRKCDPENRKCNIDGHVFEETFTVVTSRRDKDCPLVEIEERKVGKWIKETDKSLLGWYKCSICGRRVDEVDDYLALDEDNEVSDIYPYCHCGAKMEGKEWKDC